MYYGKLVLVPVLFVAVTYFTSDDTNLKAFMCLPVYNCSINYQLLFLVSSVSLLCPFFLETLTSYIIIRMTNLSY